MFLLACDPGPHDDRIQRHVTTDAVARHLGIEPDEAERMARQLDDAGLWCASAAATAGSWSGKDHPDACTRLSAPIY